MASSPPHPTSTPKYSTPLSWLHPPSSRLLFWRTPLAALAAAATPGLLPSIRAGPTSAATMGRRCCRAAAGSGAPSPPPSDPPPPSGTGWQARLSRFQDRVRIFFTVLFWMSLFFWGSAWDGSNNSGGKKRQQFRKKTK